MPESAIRFQTLITIPGSREAEPPPGSIPYDAMMATIDRAYDRGKWHGWQEAMAAVRDASEALSPTDKQAIEYAIGQAADGCTLRTDV